ncbi:amidophosphoribosyltransferase [Candidatus Poribacteria bacterium]
MADCGIVGIFAKNRENVYERLVHSLHVLQHRGEDACGILIHNNGEFRLERKIGLVSTGFHFTPESIIDGDRGIGHTRYPTTNLSSELPSCDIQPIEISYPWTKLYIAHNGTITSFCGLPLSQTESDQQLEDEVIQEEVCDSELTPARARQLLQTVKGEMIGGTDTETVGRILAHLAQHCTLEEALKQVIPELAGSFAFLIQTDDKLIGIRDPHGIRPLCFGELSDGYVIASESCVMNELRKLYYQGTKIPRQDVPPGGGIIMSNSGVEHVRFADSPKTAFCIFEDAYFSRPDSNVRGQILSTFRQRCGERLGLRLKADFTLQEASDSIIIPIPDGGIPFGVGLARTTGIPLMSHGLIRDKYTGRTFIRGHETYGLDRTALVMRKISFLHDVLEDKIVILADDSIVRGTTTRCLSAMAVAAGARDVIYCFNFPPIRYICPLGIEMFKGGREQFIANRVIGAENLQELEIGIAKILGVKAAYYTSLEEYLQELNLTPDEACIGCTAGIYPFDEQNRLYGCNAMERENEAIMSDV